MSELSNLQKLELEYGSLMINLEALQARTNECKQRLVNEMNRVTQLQADQLKQLQAQENKGKK